MGLGFCFRLTVVCLSFIVKKCLVESASVARTINQMMEEKPQTAVLYGQDKTHIVYPPSWNRSVLITTDGTYSNSSSAKAQSVNSSTPSMWNQKVFSRDFSNGFSISSKGHEDRSESYLAPRLIMSPISLGQVRNKNKLNRAQTNYNLLLSNLLQNMYKENIFQTLLADKLINRKQHDKKTTQYATSIKITERSTIVRAKHPRIVPLKNLLAPVLSRPTDNLKNIYLFSQFLSQPCRHKLKPLYLTPSKEFHGNYMPVNFIRATINYATDGVQPFVTNKTSVKSNETSMFQTQDLKSNQHGPFAKIFSYEHYPLTSSNHAQTQKAVVIRRKSKNIWTSPLRTIGRQNTYNNSADKTSRKNETAPYVTLLRRPVTNSEFATKTVNSSNNFSSNKHKGYKNVTFNNTYMQLKHTNVKESKESDLITRTAVLYKYEFNQTNHTVVKSDLDKTDLNYFLNQGHVHPMKDISNGNDIEHFSSRENAKQSISSMSSFVIGRRINVSSVIVRKSDNLANTRFRSSVSKSPIIRKWNIKYKLSNNQTMDFSDNKTPPERVSTELTTQAKKSLMQDKVHLSNSNIIFNFSDNPSVEKMPAQNEGSTNFLVSFPKPIGLKNFTPIEFKDVAGSASFHVNR